MFKINEFINYLIENHTPVLWFLFTFLLLLPIYHFFIDSCKLYTPQLIGILISIFFMSWVLNFKNYRSERLLLDFSSNPFFFAMLYSGLSLLVITLWGFYFLATHPSFLKYSYTYFQGSLAVSVIFYLVGYYMTELKNIEKTFLLQDIEIKSMTDEI